MNKLTLRRIAARICDTVFPRKCILCGELLDPDRGAEMCEKCLGAYSDALALTCPVCGKNPTITTLIDYEQAECEGLGL